MNNPLQEYIENGRYEDMKDRAMHTPGPWEV